MPFSLKHVSLFTLVVYAMLSLLHAWQLPFSADEAHYALYASYLDWSYFDHPPMVGWLQSLVLLVSDAEFALRIIPIIFTASSVFILYYLTAKNFGQQQAWWLLLLFVSAPILNLIPFGMIPETPLVLTGMLNVLVLQKLINNKGGRIADWLMLGLIMGAAGLSKYTGVTLAFSTFIVLLIEFRLRLFTFAGVYWAGALAAICISPVLYWNYQHDWLSFTYQLNHGAGKSEYDLMKALAMQATQLASYGFAIYILGLIAIVKYIRQPNFRIWLVFALPILILFSVLSAKGRSLPHWTELGWLYILPLIAQLIVTAWQVKWQRYLISLSVALSFIIVLVGQVLLFNPNFKFPDFRHPQGDLIGWQPVAERLAELSRQGDNIFIANWSHASRIAWYARFVPVKVLDNRFDQFDLWYGQAEEGDSGWLMLHGEKKGFKNNLLSRFQQCKIVDQLEFKIQGSMVNHFKLYRCDHYIVHQDR